MINQWCDDCDLQIALHSRRPAPADFDLTVWACAGGREWELARITVRAGEPVAEYFELDVERLEGFLERVRKDPRVSVVMRPAAGGASDWRREVWYPEVVVGWGWY